MESVTWQGKGGSFVWSNLQTSGDVLPFGVTGVRGLRIFGHFFGSESQETF